MLKYGLFAAALFSAGGAVADQSAVSTSQATASCFTGYSISGQGFITRHGCDPQSFSSTNECVEFNMKGERVLNLFCAAKYMGITAERDRRVIWNQVVKDDPTDD